MSDKPQDDRAITIRARHVQGIVKSLLGCEAAIFKLSETLSRLQIGDMQAAKAANANAIEAGKAALKATNTLADDIKSLLAEAEAK